MTGADWREAKHSVEQIRARVTYEGIGSKVGERVGSSR